MKKFTLSLAIVALFSAICMAAKELATLKPEALFIGLFAFIFLLLGGILLIIKIINNINGKD